MRPALPAILAVLVAACGEPPDLLLSITPPLSPQVGVELAIPLHADAGGAPISWDWRPVDNPRLLTRRRRPTLTAYTGGTAIFRWQPIADDFGDNAIEFTARAGDLSRSETLVLRIGEGDAPLLFREPIGQGTTLDLAVAPCARIALVVESPISPAVTLGLAQPTEGATLEQTGDLTGELRFCPTARQRMESETVYPLLLTAKSDKETVSKAYVFVLRRLS